ncbi:MAG: tetratricopeptide repeat protein [Chloroflexi bacterium]|nr:tetratricopeptide repeat protein [Chloroflexota bacterium]
MVVREMPNLRRALDLALAAATSPLPSGGDREGVMDAAVDFADSISRFLDYFGRWRERDEMMEQVKSKKAKGKSEDGKLTKADFLMLDRQGDILLQQGRAADAEKLWRALLVRLEQPAAYDTAYDHAMTFLSLGRAVAAQGRPTQAIEWHRQALQAFERLSATDEDAKKMWGKVYTDLADNLVAVGKFDEAEKAYEDGLKISREVGDDRSVGVKLGQLGTLAMQRGDLKTAHARYTDALQTFRAMGEQQSEAVIWHQLGRVAQEAKQWDEAEKCYRESYKLEEQMNHLEGVAQSANQLARVAEGAGRLADAERWYLRTTELADYLPDKGARVFSNLANLYLSQRRLEEAERYARRAVEIVETHQVQTEVWVMQNILARIADARGNVAEAAQWRRKSQDSFAAYAGAAYQLPQWAGEFSQLVKQSIGQLVERSTRETLNQFLAQMENSAWRNLAAAVRRILNGERDFESLRGALNFVEAYIVRAILEGGQPSAVSGQPSSVVGHPSSTSGQPSSVVGHPSSVVGHPSSVSGQPDDDDQMVTLEQFLQTFVRACQPDAPAGLAEQMHAATRGMATQPGLQPELRELGRVLNQILSGDRNPDLSALHPQLVEAVRAVLAQL